MIHPIDSIKARRQTYIIKNFSSSKYSDYMKKIHNTHLGESCFIIGNGPSLSVEDLTAIYNKGIDSFAVNRIFKIFPETPWRPKYYVCTDYVMIRDIQDKINDMTEVKHKLIPIDHYFYHNINLDSVNYFNANYNGEKDGPDGFHLDCVEKVNMRGTVTITCAELAIHMGYRNIYFIGVDHNFDKVITEDGEVIIDPSVNNYFCEGYDDDIAEEVTHDLGQSTRGYRDLRKFCDKNSINIFNATRKTKLKEFEQVDFDEIIKTIK